MDLLLVLAVLILLVAVLGLDVTVTASSVLPGAGDIDRNGIGGMAITAGQLVYKDTAAGATNGQYLLADANAAGKQRIDGVALNSCLAQGQPLSVQRSGIYTAGGTVVVGQVYVLSGTAGGIAPVADLASGMTVCVFGVGLTATQIQIAVHNSGAVVP